MNAGKIVLGLLEKMGEGAKEEKKNSHFSLLFHSTFSKIYLKVLYYKVPVMFWIYLGMLIITCQGFCFFNCFKHVCLYVTWLMSKKTPEVMKSDGTDEC